MNDFIRIMKAYVQRIGAGLKDAMNHCKGDRISCRLGLVAVVALIVLTAIAPPLGVALGLLSVHAVATH